MILDSTTTFTTGVSIAAAAGTDLVGDVIDLDVADRRLGGNHKAKLIITVTEAFTSGGSATVQFKLASDAAAAIATDGSATEHWGSHDFPVADLTVGKRIVVPLPSGIPASERYLGILAVTGTATTTAGSISASIVLDADDLHAFPDAVN